MEVRRLTEADRPQVDYVVSQAFYGGARRPGGAEEPGPAPYDAVGVFEGGTLQAQAVVIAYRVHLGPDVVVPMGGIAGVACLPASRGKGHAGTAVTHTLEMMREAGQVVSSLFPFSWDYYRRFGWEWVGVGRRYTVPASTMRADRETEAVRLATEEDRPGVEDAYARFAGRYRGMLARGERHWDEMLAHGNDKYRFVYVHEADGAIDGYVLLDGTSHESTDVREFVFLSEPARRGLLGLMRRHAMQTNQFRWSAPEDDLLWHSVNHWDVKTSVGPVTQARIVDVPAALRAWRPAAAGTGDSCVLRVHDDCAPWNDGTWRVATEGDRVAAEPCADSPQVETDVRALSQAYWGTPGLTDCRRAGNVQVNDERGYRALEAVLSGPPMWMNDSF